MKKITIEEVTINSFRNIKNVHYDLTSVKSNGIAFCGDNKLGKTNTINAIMWCLTGADIDNNAVDQDNIPYGYNEDTDGEYAIDVEVKLSVGTIRRCGKVNGGSVKEILFINGEEADTLKNGEVKIDSMLGTLQMGVINKSKKFDVRKFCLNPMYTQTMTPKDFREFIISIIEKEVDTNKIFESLGLRIKSSLLRFNSTEPTRISELIDKEIKESKKNLENAKIVLKWVEEHYPNDVDIVKREISLAKGKLQDLELDSIASDKFSLEVNKAYQKSCKKYFDGIEFCLLEKGVGEDVWKNVCYPIVPNSNVELKLGSTSERVILGSRFIVSVISKFSMCSKLPIIFDECETLDHKSTYSLSMSTDTQLITAKVESGHDGKIVMKGI